MKSLIILILFLSTNLLTQVYLPSYDQGFNTSQVLQIADKYQYQESQPEYEEINIEEFYEKIELKSGALDENGNPINHVYLPTDLKKGEYEVSVSDALVVGLYKIIGTNYYLKFSTHAGYMGFGTEGILVVNNSPYRSKFYREKDSLW